MSKQALRREMRARLRAFAPARREEAGREIARRVWTLSEIADARVLLLFASLPEEVPSAEIAREAGRRGIALLYPRVIAESGALAVHRVNSPEDLRVGAFGVREPDPAISPPVPISLADAALVPGLAWDRRGNRLGRGGGFYDRLLGAPEWRAWRCGLFFALQEVPAVPADSWDIPLDAVATEGGVYRVSGRGPNGW